MLRTILVVDDDSAIRESVRDVLTDAGYAAVTASNGAEALQFLQAGAAVDLVLLDLRMPVMSGYELLRQLQASERHRSLRVVLLTGEAPTHLATAPADGYVAKPFPVEHLLGTIERVLRRIPSDPPPVAKAG